MPPLSREQTVLNVLLLYNSERAAGIERISEKNRFGICVYTGCAISMVTKYGYARHFLYLFVDVFMFSLFFFRILHVFLAAYNIFLHPHTASIRNGMSKRRNLGSGKGKSFCSQLRSSAEAAQDNSLSRRGTYLSY